MVRKRRRGDDFVEVAIARAKSRVDPDIAAITGCLADALTLIHELAPRRMEETLRERRRRVQDLELGRRRGEFAGQLAAERLGIEIFEHAMGRQPPSPAPP